MGNNKKEKSNKKNEAQENKNTIPNNAENKELVVKKEKTFKEKKAKWIRQTSLTVALILIIVAACIGINILVEEVNIADIDFTQDKVYSLSDMSKSMISGIDQEVTITIFNMNESVEDFAKKYNSENKNIKVEVVEDLSTRPDITDEYGITSDSNIIIVSSGDKEKLLSSYDLYTTDYTTYQTKDITEEALTNAIIDVTTEEKPVIYYLTGHEKYSVDYVYYFRADLENEAYEFNELDLLTAGEVPEDCSVLMISSLASDLTEAEKDAILNYIDKGGKIILFADPNTSGDEMPNFQEVLDEYGVEIDEGIMLEEDSDRMLLGTPNAILVTVSPYTSVTKAANMNMNACFMNSGRIEIADSEELEELGVQAETLATTGADSYYRTNYSLAATAGKTDADEEAGNATVGALLKKTIDDDTTSEMIVYANNIFVTNVQVQISQTSAVAALDLYNNEDLAMNSVAYLSGRDNMITIRKDIETTNYTVTDEQNTIILSIIFTIPVVIMLAGIIVWQYRRRKK